ncbi:SDR family oxidoreductase [Novosphingobium bradum]|uniref:SDR family oxidoreductase n=1 Tax=Novosphingobium bradum TaxID=1737444 RepID=A0ABV7IJA4_9SPHN
MAGAGRPDEETISMGKLIITGAAGGMGRACARLLGAAHSLILTDVAAGPLDAFAAELRREGIDVVGTFAGDLGDAGVLAGLTGALDDGAPFALVHTAGLSPSMADARTIMDVNLVATAKLLAALEPRLAPGSAAVLIASMAGYSAPAIEAVDALMADPLAPGFLDAITGAMEAMLGQASPMASGMSYAFSKRGVLRIVERLAPGWGARGGRITSISPGTIATPMGQLELDSNPQVGQILRSTPAGREGRAMDIAFAARFLLGAEASFITGCDLRVDGGAMALAHSA